MRKSDKKRENAIVTALTQACENDLKSYKGFQWITHVVDFQRYPESLVVICVFDTNENVQKLLATGEDATVKRIIESYLLSYSIPTKNVKQRIFIDTEQACEDEFNGNWNKRLANFQHARHT